MRSRAMRGLGVLPGVVMDVASVEARLGKGIGMAEEEPLLVDPPTQDVAIHVRDYSRFTAMLKWGAIVCLILGFLVLLIISS